VRNGVQGLRVRPVVGPTDGNTTVQFIGVNFVGGDDYRCRFSIGDSGEVDAASMQEDPNPSATLAITFTLTLALALP